VITSKRACGLYASRRQRGLALGTLESFATDPKVPSGIPSLDGNGDGWTCAEALRTLSA
jgi:hypothetical protein